MFNDVESTERALQELNDTVLEGRRIKLRKVCKLLDGCLC